MDRNSLSFTWVITITADKVSDLCHDTVLHSKPVIKPKLPAVWYCTNCFSNKNVVIPTKHNIIQKVKNFILQQVINFWITINCYTLPYDTLYLFIDSLGELCTNRQHCNYFLWLTNSRYVMNTYAEIFLRWM